MNIRHVLCGLLAADGARVRVARRSRRARSPELLVSCRSRRRPRQGDRRPRCRFRQGAPRYPGDADLHRQLRHHLAEDPGRQDGRDIARCRGHRDQLGPRARRPGCCPAARRDDRRRGRQEIPRQILAVDAAQLRLRRQGLRHPVPALDPGDVLQQGRVQGGGSRSGQAAAHLGRDGGRSTEADQARRRARDAMGARAAARGLQLVLLCAGLFQWRTVPQHRRHQGALGPAAGAGSARLLA